MKSFNCSNIEIEICCLFLRTCDCLYQTHTHPHQYIDNLQKINKQRFLNFPNGTVIFSKKIKVKVKPWYYFKDFFLQ